jgi:predicted ATPase
MSIRRIVVSGGPGAGKTTLWRSLAERHATRVIAVPEVATLLLAHVFPSVQNQGERHALQRAIFQVQRNLERVHDGRLGPDQVLLCDRGVPDGAGYWPQGPEDFFARMHTIWSQELARYDAVLFMESAAVGGFEISDNNPTRSEDLATAVQLDQRLRGVWQSHPSFHHIPHERDFSVKLTRALEIAERLLV